MDIDWKKVINTIPGPYPEVGLDAPDEEMIPEMKDPRTIVGNLTRLYLEIFMFDSDDLEQAYMMQNEKMKIYKDISLRDAAIMYKRSSKKKT